MSSPAVRKAVKRFNIAFELRQALNESVRLQSHYAKLLNAYDGGKRKVFADGDAWIRRLREVEENSGVENYPADES